MIKYIIIFVFVLSRKLFAVDVGQVGEFARTNSAHKYYRWECGTILKNIKRTLFFHRKSKISFLYGKFYGGDSKKFSTVATYILTVKLKI